jgi:hypothetical protein
MESTAETIDEQDYAILARLGYAVARAQLFEFAMLKLVEAQRHDPAEPLDERWSEVETWLTKWTAGKISKELAVPEEIATDLRNAVARRNVVAHHAWRFYVGARAKRGDSAVAEYSDWLDEEARIMGRAYGGLLTIMHALKGSTTPLATAAVLAIWREHLPTPVHGVTVPGPEPDTSADAAAAKFKNEP